MQCTCGYPTGWLLPCRHVLAANNHIFSMQFRVSQVGKRWLRAYMPAVSDHSLPPHLSYQPPLDISVPSLSSTVPIPSANIPARNARWGQLTGLCNIIASIATDNTDIFKYVSRKVEALCKEVEALVSKPAAARIEYMTTAASATSASSSSLPQLHPTVGVPQMVMPPHRKRKRGKPSEKRKQSAVELASKGMRVRAPTTASQSM